VREATASRTSESTTKPDGPESRRVLYCARPVMICVTCQKDEQEVTLAKCPICFKWVCQDCGRREYGRVFCSQRCANLFFFGDDDE
jgi:hypothetical protein